MLQRLVDAPDSDCVQNQPVLHYRSSHMLKDRTIVVVRSASSKDEVLLSQFQETLSEQTVYTRYFAYLPLEQRLKHKRLAKDCVDDMEQMTLIGVHHLEESQDWDVLGIVQLMHNPLNNQGEFSIVVSDHAQGKGLGQLLMQCIEKVGIERGIQQIVGYILPTNSPMLSICKHLNYDIRNDTNLRIMVAQKQMLMPGLEHHSTVTDD